MFSEHKIFTGIMIGLGSFQIKTHNVISEHNVCIVEKAVGRDSRLLDSSSGSDTN